MNVQGYVVAAVLAATPPSALLAASVDAPEYELFTFADYSNFGTAVATDQDVEVGPEDEFFESESLVSGFARPHRGVPNSLGTAFVSAVGDSNGGFGVGVNAFFDPGDRAVASPAARVINGEVQVGEPASHVMTAFGSLRLDLFNDSGEVVEIEGNGFIPPSSIRFSFIEGGNFLPSEIVFPSGMDAEVRVLITTTLTRVDGSTQRDTVFEYGMTAKRDAGGRLGVTPLGDAEPVPQFFGFDLPELDFSLDTIALLLPGESVALEFSYLARGSTLFDNTGVFAAIGDPFDIRAGGGSFAFTQGNGVVPPPPPSPVPLPASLPLLVVGVAILVGTGRLGRKAGTRQA